MHIDWHFNRTNFLAELTKKLYNDERVISALDGDDIVVPNEKYWAFRHDMFVLLEETLAQVGEEFHY